MPGRWRLLVALFGDVKEIPFHAAYIVFSLIAALGDVVAGAAILAASALGHAAVSAPCRRSWSTAIRSRRTCRSWRSGWRRSPVRLRPNRLGGGRDGAGGARSLSGRVPDADPVVMCGCCGRKGDTAWRWPLHLRQSQRSCRRADLRALLPRAPCRLPCSPVTSRTTDFQALAHKLRSAAALAIHSWFIVCPLLVPGAAILAWRNRRDRNTQFLLAWIGLFFAGAVVVFFAGSARYLLPWPRPWRCWPRACVRVGSPSGFALQMALERRPRHGELRSTGPPIARSRRLSRV